MVKKVMARYRETEKQDDINDEADIEELENQQNTRIK